MVAAKAGAVPHIGPQHSEAEGGASLVGDYGNRLIRVYPCPHCSAGYLTLTFLHELAHAWIDVFHPDFPDDHTEEEFAETFCSLRTPPYRRARARIARTGPSISRSPNPQVQVRRT